MYFSIIKKVTIVLFLTAFPISTFAVGLGSVNMTSALGEPLNASIELLSMTPAELSSLQAKIDSEAAYVEQGLTRLAVHDEIKLRIIKDAGNNILKLTSNSVIADPVLDLLVVVGWSNGRVSRQYTVLLDPPSYNPAATQTQAPATNQFDNASIKKTNADSANQSQSAASSAQEHLTKSGDTLYKVARRMQPAGVDLNKVLVALFEANRDAFDGKNMNRLKVGKILQAPSEDALNTMTDKHANSEIKLQTADWNKYRNKLAEAIAQKAAQASDEDMQSSSGKINSAAEDKSASTDEFKDVVKLSTVNTNEMNADTQAKLTALQEEVSAREKGLKEAENRTAALEKQIEDMQKLLALKNNAMLNAQEQSAQNEAVVQAGGHLEQDKSEITTEAADKTTTKPLEAEKPIVAPSKTVAAPDTNQPSFFASLLDTALDKVNSLNKLLLLGVAAIVALLVGIWLYIRSKRNKQLQDFEQGNPLYQLKASSENQSAELKFAETEPDEPNLLQPDSYSTHSAQAELTEFKPETNEEVDGELDASDFTDSPLAAAVDLDFSISDNADFDFCDDNETLQNELDMKSANILDFSGISLDIGDEVSFATDSESEQGEGEEAAIEEPMTPAHEEVETKLELVAAYIDMEDKDGAKELLEEVLKEGSLSQRKRADQILASLV